MEDWEMQAQETPAKAPPQDTAPAGGSLSWEQEAAAPVQQILPKWENKDLVEQPVKDLAWEMVAKGQEITGEYPQGKPATVPEIVQYGKEVIQSPLNQGAASLLTGGPESLDSFREGKQKLANVQAAYQQSGKGPLDKASALLGAVNISGEQPERTVINKAVGMTGVGVGLDFAQKNITRPFMVGLHKSYEKALNPELYPELGVTEEQARSEKLNLPAAADREFAQRTAGTTFAQLPQPSKQTVPSVREMNIRRLGSSFTGDSGKLSPEHEAMVKGTMPGPELAKDAMTGGLELIGELPFYIALTTGTGARLAKQGTARALASNLPPKQMAKAVATAQARGVALEFGVQSAAIASKNNQDVATQAGAGYMSARVLSRLWELASANSAGKRAVMSKVNTERAWASFEETGIVAPPMSWKAFVEETTATAKRGGSGSPSAPFTYKTVEFNDKGELMDVRILNNARTGESKVVYEAPLSSTTQAEYLKTGRPIPTNRDAYGDYADWVLPEGNPAHSEAKYKMGKTEYMSPEQAVKHTGDNMGLTEKDAAELLNKTKYAEGFDSARPVTTKAQMERNATPTANMRPEATPNEPVVLTASKNGDVTATPILDRKPTTEALSPRRVEPGDVVQTHDGQPALVEETRGGTVSLRMSNGQKVEASQADVSLANESLLPPVVKANTKADLLKYKRLDVERVMTAMGEDNPAKAARILLDMKDSGMLLDGDKIGEFVVNPKYKTPYKFDPASAGDKIVYYAVDPNTGMGKSGVNRGPDPKVKGNSLIEIGYATLNKTNANPAHTAKAQALGVSPSELFVTSKTISVPDSQLRPYFVGDASKSTIPQMWGIGRPMPKDTVITGAASAAAIAEHSAKAGALSKLTGISKEVIKNYLAKFVVNDAFLTPLDVRDTAFRLGAQKGLVKAEANSYQKSLGGMLGGELSANDSWLANIMKRQATQTGNAPSARDVELLKFFNANPQMGAEVESTVRTALSRLKANQTEMARLGIANIADLEAARAAGLEDEYAMNVYLKYLTTRKDYASFVKKQMPSEWERAVKHVAKSHPSWHLSQVESEMLHVMGLNIENTKAELAQAAGPVAKKLKARIQMSDEIKKVLGSVDSAAVQLSHSLAASDSILQRVKDWNTLQATPYWSPGPRADLGPHNGIPVPNQPIYGNAAGGYMHESFRFLLEAQPAHVEARSMLRWMSSVWKFNHVIAGGPVTWVNQGMRNWKGLYISGGLQGPHDFATFFDAAEEMLLYSMNPIKGKSSIFAEAMNNGANSTGMAGSEIFKNKATRRILDAIKKQRGKSADLSDLMTALSSQVRGGAQEMGAAYDAIDRVFKLTAYMNIRRRALSQGMNINDATALATMRVKQSFPDFENVAPVIEKLRGGSVSGIAPFLSSKAEDMRVNGMLLMRLKDEPDLLARLMVMGGIMAATAALIREQRRANGITDDMVTRAIDTQPLNVQKYKTAQVVWPELDSQKRMQSLDFTSWEDALSLFQHHENDFLPAAIMRNAVQGYMGESTLSGQIVGAGMSKLAGVVPLSPPPDLSYRPGEYGPLEFLAFLAQSGGVPQGGLKAYNQYMLTQPQETVRGQLTREQWDANRGLQKFMGAPWAAPIGTKTETARALEFKTNEGEMQKQIFQTIMNKPVDEQEALIQSKVKQIELNAEEFNENR